MPSDSFRSIGSSVPPLGARAMDTADPLTSTSPLLRSTGAPPASEAAPESGIGPTVLTIPPPLLATAAAVCQQIGLLSNDGLIVAVMQANGLTRLASSDRDFDRVPWLTRYEPI